MKGALLGAGALASGSAWEIAQAMATGKKAGDVRGYGVEPGRVQIGANENPLGASSRPLPKTCTRSTGTISVSICPFVSTSYTAFRVSRISN